jgi:ABC-type branched-subunit amino acid transport system substrate-binding protein
MNEKRFAFVILLGLPLVVNAGARADGLAGGQLTEQEKRGKQIYVRGSSRSGKEITCFLGDAATEMPATAMLCSGCHGLDGRGNPEGGVVPSDITWQALTKSYGVAHAGGRKHPPYTDRALGLAITKGLDPGGNRLQDTMPRYWMSQEDLADLVAYIKRLGGEQDPGVSESLIRVGAILPLRGQMSELGLATKAALEAYFAEINNRGGIFNRKIELRVAEPGADPKSAKAAAEQFIDREQVFAMAGAFIAGADKEIISMVEDKEVPLIAPYTLYPEVGFPLNRHTFYLLAGLKEQARALVNFAGDKLQKQNLRIVIFGPDAGGAPGVQEAIEEQCKKRQYQSVSRVTYTRRGFDVARMMQSLRDADAVFILRFGEEEIALLKEAEKLKSTPCFFIPGAVAGREIMDSPAGFKDKIFLSFPTLPSDQTGESVLEYRALAEKYKLPGRHLPTQISAFCAAKILVEALKLAGKDVSREKLIRALEGFYEFETGLTPRITYGPNRRIGALGAYIVTIDPEKKEFKPVSGWITAE